MGKVCDKLARSCNRHCSSENENRRFSQVRSSSKLPSATVTYCIENKSTMTPAFSFNHEFNVRVLTVEDTDYCWLISVPLSTFSISQTSSFISSSPASPEAKTKIWFV